MFNMYVYIEDMVEQGICIDAYETAEYFNTSAEEVEEAIAEATEAYREEEAYRAEVEGEWLRTR